MVPGLDSQNKIVQQLSYCVNSQSTDIQNKVQQEYEKQSKKNRSTEEVNSEEAEIHTNDPTSTNSNGSLSNGSTASTGQEIVKPIKVEDIDKEINAITEALTEISNCIKSVEEALNKELAESDSSIHDEIYKKKKTKPRWPITSSDINYKKDKGGNYHMTLIYNSDSNDVRFSKDDDPVIIIKNDNVKNEGDYWRFVAKIRECCEQKKGYYFEDYLKDHGFMKEQNKEKIDISKKLDEIMSLLIDESSLEM